MKSQLIVSFRVCVPSLSLTCCAIISSTLTLWLWRRDNGWWLDVCGFSMIFCIWLCNSGMQIQMFISHLTIWLCFCYHFTHRNAIRSVYKLNTEYIPIHSSLSPAKTPHSVYISVIHVLQSIFSLPNIPNCFALRKCYAPNSIEFDCDDIPERTFQRAVRFVCQYHKMLNIDETLRHHDRWIRQALKVQPNTQMPNKNSTNCYSGKRSNWIRNSMKNTHTKKKRQNDWK